MSYQNILVSIQEQIALITINRPDKLNALNMATIAELHQVLISIEDDPQVRVVILTGSGNKAFVAGADIAEFMNFSVKQGQQLAQEGQSKLFDYIAQMSTPVIAAINGFALGGGLELAMSAHLRIASENAQMGLPEVSLGVIPGYGGTQRLPQLVGKSLAMEMILTAERINAQKALQYGLVNYVTQPDNLLPTAEKIALKIIRNSPVAIATAITAIQAGYIDGVNGYKVEIEGFGNCFDTRDFKEGTTAFMEKRKPVFPGK